MSSFFLLWVLKRRTTSFSSWILFSFLHSKWNVLRFYELCIGIEDSYIWLIHWYLLTSLTILKVSNDIVFRVGNSSFHRSEWTQDLWKLLLLWWLSPLPLQELQEQYRNLKAQDPGVVRPGEVPRVHYQGDQTQWKGVDLQAIACLRYISQKK